MVKLPDTSGVKERLLKGEVLVAVKSAKEGQGEKGAFLEWCFEIAEGEFKKFLVWERTSLSENSLWRIKQLKTSLGVGDKEIEVAELIGKQLRLVLKQEVYNGEPQLKVKRFKKVKD